MHRDTRSIVVEFFRAAAPDREKDVLPWAENRANALRAAAPAGLLDIHCYSLRPWQGAKPDRFHWRDEDFERGKRGAFVMIYEFAKDDPAAVKQALAAAPKSPAGEIVDEGWYRHQITLHPTGLDQARLKETNGIMVAAVHPRDEDRYEAWYVSTHLDDEIRHGGNHSVTRFLHPEPGGRPKSFTLLETDWPDISAARNHVLSKYFPNWRYPPGIEDAFEIVTASDYQRVF